MTDMDKEELRAIRSTLGMTQQELATALGLSHRDTVRAWEGRTPATPIPGPVALALRLVVRLKEAADDTANAVLDGLWTGA
jgi:DNA-binding transcriptional regulator YiaG